MERRRPTRRDATDDTAVRGGSAAVAGLPPGWASDYDGRRWFYTHGASGRVQYHFPSEGDEFPDFVDVTAPPPRLVPEERLESQQQVHLQTGSATAAAISATAARPVSAEWYGGEDGHGGGRWPLQPQGLMFLGPSLYSDVSPLHEEEEEAAARRVVAGQGSEAAPAPAPTPAEQPAPTPTPTEQPVPESPLAATKSPVAHTTDGGEAALELLAVVVAAAAAPVFDPVGVIAELPTEHTAAAPIELHPDPIELADNSVLAPIETAVAELPGESSPVGPRASPAAATVPDRTQKDRQQDRATIPPHAVPMSGGAAQGIRMARKPLGSLSPQAYKAYSPGQGAVEPPPTLSGRRVSSAVLLHREASLLRGLRPPRADMDPSTVPSILSPAQQPPLGSPASSAPPPPCQLRASAAAAAAAGPGHQDGLSSVPSVLRPAGGGGAEGSLTPAPARQHPRPHSEGHAVPGEPPAEAPRPPGRQTWHVPYRGASAGAALSRGPWQPPQHASPVSAIPAPRDGYVSMPVPWEGWPRAGPGTASTPQQHQRAQHSQPPGHHSEMARLVEPFKRASPAPSLAQGIEVGGSPSPGSAAAFRGPPLPDKIPLHDSPGPLEAQGIGQRGTPSQARQQPVEYPVEYQVVVVAKHAQRAVRPGQQAMSPVPRPHPQPRASPATRYDTGPSFAEPGLQQTRRVGASSGEPPGACQGGVLSHVKTPPGTPHGRGPGLPLMQRAAGPVPRDERQAKSGAETKSKDSKWTRWFRSSKPPGPRQAPSLGPAQHPAQHPAQAPLPPATHPRSRNEPPLGHGPVMPQGHVSATGISGDGWSHGDARQRR